MFLITIDGPSGSGKTSLASLIESSLMDAGEKVFTIHMDDLYDGWENALGNSLRDRILAIINEADESSRITVPHYNWERAAFGEPRSIPTPETLILEGVGSGQSAVRECADISLWLDCPLEIALSRAIARDGAELSELLKRWQLQEAAHFLLEKTESAADYRVKSAP
jgi:uridine kinase